MSLILSLQGGMAAGKTTAAQFLRAHEPRVYVSLEDIRVPLARTQQLGLNKKCFSDYIEIQRLFIENEIKRWQDMQKYPFVVTDLGASEIEFYTLQYPRSIGEEWPVEQALCTELEALRRCKAQRTLFLDASAAVLRARKNADDTRQRGFFEHTVTHLLPAKRAWFAAQPGTDFLCTDTFTQEALCTAVHQWVSQWLV